MDEKTRLGALAEAKVAAELIGRGWEVFTPFSGKAPFDLVASRGLVLLRVEVKGCATRRPSGGFAVSLPSVRPNRRGNAVRYLSADVSDVLAIYIKPVDAVCFFWTRDLAGRNSITLHESAKASRDRHLVGDYATLDDGAVAEWTKATALKVVDPQGSVGSNPTRSASPASEL
jgi:hypothetical protein